MREFLVIKSPHTLRPFSSFISSIPCDFSAFHWHMALQREMHTDPKMWVLCKKDGNRIQIFLPTASRFCCKVTTGSTIGCTHKENCTHAWGKWKGGKSETWVIFWFARHKSTSGCIPLGTTGLLQQNTFLDPAPFVIF